MIPDWLFEPKFDGFRGLLYINADSATFYSKRGLVLKRFSRLAADVRDALGVRNAILDGEVLAIDETGQHNFRSLMSSMGHLHYSAFDLLSLRACRKEASCCGPPYSTLITRCSTRTRCPPLSSTNSKPECERPRLGSCPQASSTPRWRTLGECRSTRW